MRAHAIVEYYRAAEIAYPQALKSRGYRDDEIGTHAGLADTSLALAVDPRLVRTDTLQAGEPPARAEGVYGRSAPRDAPSSGNRASTRSSRRRSTRSSVPSPAVMRAPAR